MNDMKNYPEATLVIGASPDASRYSYRAVKSLVSKGHPVIAFSKKRGSIDDVVIHNDWNTTWDVDTVTLYINPGIQKDYYEPIIGLNPRRVIFNPGTENGEFAKQLRAKGIDTENACTLVLLATGEY